MINDATSNWTFHHSNCGSGTGWKFLTLRKSMRFGNIRKSNKEVGSLRDIKCDGVMIWPRSIQSADLHEWSIVPEISWASCIWDIIVKSKIGLIRNSVRMKTFPGNIELKAMGNLFWTRVRAQRHNNMLTSTNFSTFYRKMFSCATNMHFLQWYRSQNAQFPWSTRT